MSNRLKSLVPYFLVLSVATGGNALAHNKDCTKIEENCSDNQVLNQIEETGVITEDLALLIDTASLSLENEMRNRIATSAEQGDYRATGLMIEAYARRQTLGENAKDIVMYALRKAFKKCDTFGALYMVESYGAATARQGQEGRQGVAYLSHDEIVVLRQPCDEDLTVKPH